MTMQHLHPSDLRAVCDSHEAIGALGRIHQLEGSSLLEHTK